ncbi:MAG: ABC transporter permease [Anaerolineales bacterium]|jgi:putative ABC transport system permease protein
MAFYLSIKEVWRNRGRFLLFSLVIALITLLVLFVAALGEGLATANKEYFDKLNADLLVFQENTNYSTIESRLDYGVLKNVRRMPGVADVGAIAFSNVKIVLPQGQETLDISLIGIEPGKPGSPPVFEGQEIRTKRAKEIVLDASIAETIGAKVGDLVTVSSTQGTEEELYSLKVIGVTDGRQYFYQPSAFVSLQIWDEIRPQAAIASSRASEPVPNILAVRLVDPTALAEMSAYLQSRIKDIEVTDIKTAYQSFPGYTQQQGTVNTIKGFTFLIGVLVIGGFFQIQTLQKVPQIGMLKAIGTSNHIVANAAILQIFLVTLFGVIIGSLVTWGLAIGIPAGVPILFQGTAVAIAIIALMLIGPIGGLVSVRMALKVEPLTALGM